MKFRDSFIMSQSAESSEGVTCRGACLRCDTKYKATDMEALNEVLGKHICDSQKSRHWQWVLGQRRV
jgi:hypothetical protein